jgi:hypothetical protein
MDWGHRAPCWCCINLLLVTFQPDFGAVLPPALFEYTILHRFCTHIDGKINKRICFVYIYDEEGGHLQLANEFASRKDKSVS